MMTTALNEAEGLPMRNIYSHTGLRGIAAICVYLCHLGLPDPVNWGAYHLFFRFFDWAGDAVNLFFMLSGFILFWVYCSRENPIHWGSYLRARIARIMPLYYLTTLICLPVALFSFAKHGVTYVGRDFPMTLLFNALMVSGILSGNAQTINFPAWSISVEFFCYLALFPLLVISYRFLRKKWYFKLLSIIIVILSSYWLSLCYWFVPVTIFHMHWISSWCARGVFGFSAGFFLCAVHKMLPRHRPAVAVVNLMIIVSVTVFLLTLMDYLPFTVRCYTFPFLVYFTAFDVGIVALILKLAPLQWLGERSYSIYLWHMPVIFFQIYVCSLLKIPDQRSLSLTILMVILVLVISDLSYRYFETPCRDYIRNIGPVKRVLWSC